MGKARNIIGGGLVAASLAGSILTLGVAIAGAVPDVEGRPYRDAKSLITGEGLEPVVATRTGSGADEDKCIVTNAWQMPILEDRTSEYAQRQVAVAINCNAQVASVGVAGNSAASPEGREAKAAEEEADDAEEQELAEAATPGA